MTDLNDWRTLDQVAEGYPQFTRETLVYLCRSDVRRHNGFNKCVRFLTPRKKLISLSRFAKWIEKQSTEGGSYA